jgi:hypothetical protein
MRSLAAYGHALHYWTLRRDLIIVGIMLAVLAVVIGAFHNGVVAAPVCALALVAFAGARRAHTRLQGLR